MANIIQIRRDTAANWTAANPTLAQGEQGFEIDTGKLKIGTGLVDWLSLPYYTTNNAGVVTFENLNANGDVGVGADQVAAGNHRHDIFSIPAGQSLSSARGVYINAGKAYYFDPSNEALSGRFAGLSVNAALTDELVKIQHIGVFHEVGLTLTLGAVIYMGANGALSETPPLSGVIQIVGHALDSETIELNFFNYITI